MPGTVIDKDIGIDTQAILVATPEMNENDNQTRTKLAFLEHNSFHRLDEVQIPQDHECHSLI
jgi:hypothetical protein